MDLSSFQRSPDRTASSGAPEYSDLDGRAALPIKGVSPSRDRAQQNEPNDRALADSSSRISDEEESHQLSVSIGRDDEGMGLPQNDIDFAIDEIKPDWRQHVLAVRVALTQSEQEDFLEFQWHEQKYRRPDHKHYAVTRDAVDRQINHIFTKRRPSRKPSPSL